MLIQSMQHHQKHTPPPKKIQKKQLPLGKKHHTYLTVNSYNLPFSNKTDRMIQVQKITWFLGCPFLLKHQLEFTSFQHFGYIICSQQI